MLDMTKFDAALDRAWRDSHDKLTPDQTLRFLGLKRPSIEEQGRAALEYLKNDALFRRHKQKAP